MSQEDITNEPVTDGVDVAPAEGGEAVESVAEPAITLSQLKEVTGKEFKDVEGALKSIKDTNNYVGKKQEAAKEEAINSLDPALKELLESKSKTEMELKRKMFYMEHPEYKVASGLIERMGGDPYELVEDESFKEAFSKISGYEKAQEEQNVLKSSSRAKSDTIIEKQDHAKKTGDTADWAEVLKDLI